MVITIHLKETSQEIIHSNVLNTYQKGDFYCVLTKPEVFKYPISTIFRIVEANNV